MLEQVGETALVRTHGELAFDIGEWRCRVGAREVDLTLTEAKILWLLLHRPGQCVRLARLLETVWRGRDVVPNNLTVQINRLRNKIGRAWIETVPGVGYRMKKA